MCCCLLLVSYGFFKRCEVSSPLFVKVYSTSTQADIALLWVHGLGRLSSSLDWPCPVVTVFVLLSVLAYLYLMMMMVMTMTMMMTVPCSEYMALDAEARLCQTDAATKNINLVKNTANDISLKFLKRVWGILTRKFLVLLFSSGGNWFYSVSWSDKRLK